MGLLRDLFKSGPTPEEIREIHEDLEGMGLHYEYTTASTRALADLLSHPSMREAFMNALIEHVRTQPVTHTQYQMLDQVASSVVRKVNK